MGCVVTTSMAVSPSLLVQVVPRSYMSGSVFGHVYTPIPGTVLGGRFLEHLTPRGYHSMTVGCSCGACSRRGARRS